MILNNASNSTSCPPLKSKVSLLAVNQLPVVTMQEYSQIFADDDQAGDREDEDIFLRVMHSLTNCFQH